MATNPKIVLKTPWASIYTDNEEERAKKNIWSKNFQKSAQNGPEETYLKIGSVGAQNINLIDLNQ